MGPWFLELNEQRNTVRIIKGSLITEGLAEAQRRSGLRISLRWLCYKLQDGEKRNVDSNRQKEIILLP